MKTLHQFIKYIIVGTTGGIITSYGNIIFQLIGLPEYTDIFHIPLLLIPWSLGLAISCATINNFIMNKYWTFKE